MITNFLSVCLAGSRERRNEKTTMCRHYVRGPSERLPRHLRLTPSSGGGSYSGGGGCGGGGGVPTWAPGDKTRAAPWRGLYPQLFRAGALHKNAAPRKRPAWRRAGRRVAGGGSGRGAICPVADARAALGTGKLDRPRLSAPVR